MTDINASLKKTIDGEPGPQYKEKGKAEFNFAEGEGGTPYSYDKKVESRLTAIENKLDSVIENGSVNTQLTGSNVEDGIKVKNTLKKEVVLRTNISVPAGSHIILVNNISIIDDEIMQLELLLRVSPAFSNYFSVTSYVFSGGSSNYLREDRVGEGNNSVIAERLGVMGNSWRVRLYNASDIDRNVNMAGVWGVYV